MANTVERNASSSSSKAVGAFSRQEHELRNPLLGSGSPVVFTPDLERASSASATPPNGQKLLPADDSPQLPSRPSEGNSTVSQVAYNIVNAVVGAGIVGLPHALQMSGLWMGVFLMVFMAWLCDFSVRLLVTTGMRANCLNYEALMERLFGIKGYIAVLVTMFCYDFGAMLTYLIIMGSTGRKIFDEFLPEDILHSDTSPLGDPERRRQICITVLAVVTILPLPLSRHIKARARRVRVDAYSRRRHWRHTVHRHHRRYVHAVRLALPAAKGICRPPVVRGRVWHQRVHCVWYICVFLRMPRLRVFDIQHAEGAVAIQVANCDWGLPCHRRADMPDVCYSGIFGIPRRRRRQRAR